jgi:hypothetical protein
MFGLLTEKPKECVQKQSQWLEMAGKSFFKQTCFLQNPRRDEETPQVGQSKISSQDSIKIFAFRLDIVAIHCQRFLSLVLIRFWLCFPVQGRDGIPNRRGNGFDSNQITVHVIPSHGWGMTMMIGADKGAPAWYALDIPS